MSLDFFHSAVRNWFTTKFGSPTDVQMRSWPSIQKNLYTLISAPTGSGKTLAAFMVAIDDLIKQHVAGNLSQQTQILYISPLKALGNDIERNLRELFEGITKEIEKSANMLLKRYGIVFRKIAEKEKLLFLWYDLLKIYRKMEARGLIRGGRFVEGLGGEHYALPEAVSLLRALRKEEQEEKFISISAADPLNFTGFITPGRRIPAFHGNRILYRNGTPVAYKEGKDVVFTVDFDQETEWKLKKILLQREVQPELRPYLTY